MLRQIRQIVASPPFADSAFGFEVYGDVPMMLDAVDEVERESPAIIGGVTAIAIFAMAGLAFRSLLIPLRLVATIVTTLAIVLAAAVVAFQVPPKRHSSPCEQSVRATSDLVT